ncbi:MAG: flagellin, partial [Selenomonadaceae bacterium]|nr:flagellin [Selenomonadaceae bacterium]
NAISKTLVEQTRLGAMEARLGYTSDNLVTMNENLESGVAAYTGSDMAKEMTEYMKYSVVSQAAQYMLANAGQNAYNVLQLLQP